MWRFTHSWPQLGWALGRFTGGGIIVVPVQDQASDSLVGLDATTGAIRWQVAATNPFATEQTLPGQNCHVGCEPIQLPPDVDAPVANTETTVIVAGQTGRTVVRGLDRLTGQQIWTSDEHFGDPSSIVVSRGSTAVDGDLVVVPTGTTIVAFDAPTGQQLWEAPRLDHPVAAYGYVIGMDSAGSPSPATQATLLDAATGEPVLVLQGQQSYRELWAIGENVVYLLDANNRSQPAGLVAFELPGGDERWRLSGWDVVGEPQQTVGNNVIVRTRGGVAMLSGADGTSLWMLPSPADSTGGINNVGAGGDVVFVTFDALPPAD